MSGDRLSSKAATFCTTGLIICLSVVTSVLVARNLGPEGRGLLLALTFWPTMLGALLSISVHEATAYHVAQSWRLDKLDSAARYEATGLALQLVLIVPVSAIVIAILPFILPERYLPELSSAIFYAAASIPCVLLDQHFKAVMQGRGAFAVLNIVRLVQPVVFSVGLMILVQMDYLRVDTVMAVTVLALACSMLAAAVGGGVRLVDRTRKAVFETMVSSRKFHAANLLLFLAAEVDKIIVISVLDDVAIGYYAVAIGLSALGSGLVVQSLALMVGREMAAAKSVTERSEVFSRSTSDGIVLLILANGAAAALAPIWIPLLFGSNFAPVVPLVIILLAMATLKGIRQLIDRLLRGVHNTSIGMVGESISLGGVLLFACVGAITNGEQGFCWGLVAAHALALATVVVAACRAFRVAPLDLWPVKRANAERLIGLVHSSRNILRRKG